MQSEQANNNDIRITVYQSHDFLHSDIAAYLINNGYTVLKISDIYKYEINQSISQIIIIEIHMPEKNHIHLIQRLKNPSTRLIMVVGKITLSEKVDSIENGVDLCLEKPVNLEEINMYIKALYRRLHHQIEPETWKLNIKSRRLHSNIEKSIVFSVQELKTLHILASNYGQIINRKIISDFIGLNYTYNAEHRINTIIFKVRNKLVNINSNFSIQNWRNEGYSLTGPKIIIED